jgi:hypothetical protein
MDLLFLVAMITGVLAIFGLGATRLGADSRDPMTDDHQRCTPGATV